jgi:FKBP-type peptidyl-prolyl cis-trans isomerase
MKKLVGSLLCATLLAGAACNKTSDEKPAAPPTPPPAQTPPPPPPKPATPPGLEAPADVAAPPPNAPRTPSGLAWWVVTPGHGNDHPGPRDTVKVHYTGWTPDGKMFDSSIPRGAPAEFPLDGVIKGWTEGVQLMIKGEKRRFWIPADLAYGATPTRPGAPAGPLVFDIELLDFTKAPPMPETPSDVAAVPKNAKKTASGLAYRVLTHGKGKQHPGPTSMVDVNYTGWTTDGHMFDSSVTRGQPASFPLNSVIPGWTEGVQLMVVGDKTRFWIPGKMAYGEGTPTPGGPPKGLLVFDVELLGIK